MVYRIPILIVTFIVCLCVSGKVQSAVVLSLTPATSNEFLPAAGNTTQVTVVANIATDVGTQNILAYELPVDLGPPTGKGLPTGWSVTAVTPLFNFPPAPGGRFNFDLNRAAVDIYAADLTSLTAPVPVTLTTTPLALYSFTVQLNDQALPGAFTASFAAGGNDFSLIDGNFAAIPSSSIIFNSATINLSAVPEPSSASLCLVPILFGLAFRRKRG
jgi:hypothetical protein